MNYRKNVIDVARKELGVHEPSGDDKYITWYNNSCRTNLAKNVPWCACFVSWVLRAAGVPISVFGNFAQCSVAVSWAKKKKIWYSRVSSYIPKPGDLIMFDWDGDRKANHVGIIESVTTNSVTTIEGNTKAGLVVDGVRRKTYTIGAKVILGYIAIEYECDDQRENRQTDSMVKKMQQILIKDFKCKIACDGIWGRNSKKAFITSIQKTLNNDYKANLSCDGIWGPKTERAFPIFSTGSIGNMVKLIQVGLNLNGYEIMADGVFGKNTFNSTTAFQKKVGIAADGIVGKNTMKNLI